MIWLASLQIWPAPIAADPRDVLAHQREQRLTRSNAASVAPTMMVSVAFSRPLRRPRPGHPRSRRRRSWRSAQQMPWSRSARSSSCRRRSCRPRALRRRRPGRTAPVSTSGVSGTIVMMSRPAARRPSRRGAGHAAGGNELLGHAAAAREKQRVTAADEMGRHGRAHDAETDESDIRHAGNSWKLRERQSRWLRHISRRETACQGDAVAGVNAVAGCLGSVGWFPARRNHAASYAAHDYESGDHRAAAGADPRLSLRRSARRPDQRVLHGTKRDSIPRPTHIAKMNGSTAEAMRMDARKARCPNR